MGEGTRFEGVVGVVLTVMRGRTGMGRMTEAYDGGVGTLCT